MTHEHINTHTEKSKIKTTTAKDEAYSKRKEVNESLPKHLLYFGKTKKNMMAITQLA